MQAFLCPHAINLIAACARIAWAAGLNRIELARVRSTHASQGDLFETKAFIPMPLPEQLAVVVLIEHLKGRGHSEMSRV
jgi:hypothetical protein